MKRKWKSHKWDLLYINGFNVNIKAYAIIYISIQSFELFVVVYVCFTLFLRLFAFEKYSFVQKPNIVQIFILIDCTLMFPSFTTGSTLSFGSRQKVAILEL